MKKTPLGILVSGNGTNLQALLDACQASDYPAKISVVVSNNPSAFALERAQKAGVPTEVVNHRDFPERTAFETHLAQLLSSHSVELVCLAGFMRLLGPVFLARFPTVLNIHPALLPAFPGLHAARQALEHGVKITGCTVHWVDEGTDTGPILAQAAVPVLASDDESSLSARIQVEEHKLYPLAVRMVAEKMYSREGRRVRVEGAPVVSEWALRNPGN